MQKLTLALAAVALAAFAAPAAAAPSVHDANVAFLLKLAHLDAMPAGTAHVTLAGAERDVPVADAFDQFASRMGNVDAGALAASASSGGACLGDCWLLALIIGGCPGATVATPIVPIPGIHLAPQAFVYGGALGTQHGEPVLGYLFDWTTKTSSAVTGPVTTLGWSDFACFSFGGFAVWFPFVDGSVTAG